MSNETGEGGNTCASPEERAPGGLGDEVQVDESGDEVTDGVSLLHYTAGETMSLDRKVLEGSGGGETPDTPHANAEETTDGDEEEVADQWPFSTVTIGEETEDDGTSRPEQQGERNRSRDSMGRAADRGPPAKVSFFPPSPSLVRGFAGSRAPLRRVSQ